MVRTLLEEPLFPTPSNLSLPRLNLHNLNLRYPCPKIDDVHYLHYQFEQGEQEHTPHVQGYLEMKDRRRVRLRTLKSKAAFRRAHLEPRRGTQQQAIQYVSKSDTRISLGAVLGEPLPDRQGRRSDLEEFVQALHTKSIQEVQESYPRQFFLYPRHVQKLRERKWRKLTLTPQPLRVIVLVGPSGVGKSVAAHQATSAAQSLPVKPYFVAEGSRSRMWIPASYDPDEDKVAVIDEFTGQIPVTDFLRLCDPLRSFFPYKGGEYPFLVHTIIFTTNIHPKEWYEDATPHQQAAVLRRINSIITVKPSLTHTVEQPQEVEIDSDVLHESLASYIGTQEDIATASSQSQDLFADFDEV